MSRFVAFGPSRTGAYGLDGRRPCLVPAGYRIPPHWHPVTENITALSGTVAFGMGEKFDENAMQDVPVGGFASMPAEMRHFFMAKSAATIQVHGTGPFAITYLNPADDPRTKKSN